MNIEGKQKYLKESKKNCRKAKTFEGKQKYFKESKKNCRKAKLFEGKLKHLKENKVIFNRILTPQGHRK